jgi:hypothetical protein
MKTLYKILVILIGFFFLFGIQEVKSQAAACAGATAIIVDGACGSGSITDATVADAPAPSCGTATRDGWYKFVATTANATVTTITTNRQLLVQVFSGACGGLTEIGCANANTTAGAQTEIVSLSGLSIGTTYYIRVVCETNNNMTLTSCCVTGATYCTFSSSSSTYYINDFSTTLGTTNITNNGSGYSVGGYGYWPAKVVTAMQGNTINFSVDFAGTTETYGFAIYVDWNQDGDFGDAGEIAYMSGSYATGFTGSVTVPLSALSGNTRMRITADYLDSTPIDCGSISDGEAEDYTFTVTALPACAGAPTGGTTNATPNPACSGVAVSLSVTGSTSASGLTYQWQSSPDNVTWSNIGGQTGITCIVNPVTSTWYRRVITCTVSGLSANSTALQVVVNLNAACYCASSATSTSDMDITRVDFGGMNNTSPVVSLVGSLGTATGVAGEYSNFWVGGFTGLPAVMQGATYPILVRIDGSAYSHRVDVYFDFNQDGDLIDAGESFAVFAYANPTLPNSTTVNITIPLSATVGNTLMRVVCVESSSTSACGTYTWGETEDYRINITAAVACAGAPTGGTTNGTSPICNGSTSALSVSGSTIATGLTYQWQSSPDNVTWTNIPGEINDVYTAAPLVSTYYRRVIKCTASGLSANSVSFQVVVNLNAACYCVSSATSTSDMDITRVSIGGMNNTSPVVSLVGSLGTATGVAGMYSNFWVAGFTGLPTLQQGNTYPLIVRIDGTAYSHRVDVYFDFNQDGDLTDAGESFPVFAYANPGLPNATTVNITIPLFATTGNTLMRVVCVESSTTSPCGTYTWGETEDYRVNITLAPACSGVPTPGTATSTISNFCNTGAPTLDVTGYTVASGLTFQWQSSPSNSPYVWSSIMGGTTTNFTPPAISQTTYYRCMVSCGGSFAYTNILTITNNAQTITGTNSPVTVVCNTAATLTATATGGTINWYANSTGGTALATGGSYSPTVTANTTFYCTASQGGSNYNVGQAAWTPADGYTGIADWGIRFNAIAPFTIVSVDVYVQTAGSTVSIELQDNTGIPIGTPVNYSTTVVGLNVIPLNINIPIGNDYRLVSNNTTNLGRGSTGVAFPYTIAGVCSLTASEWGGTTTSTYYFLYNWVISTGCESSPRTPVNVIVSGGVTAPVCSNGWNPANNATGICPVGTVLSWNPSNTACQTATSYKLYFGTNTPPTNIINGTDIGNVTSYNVGNLLSTTTYYWRIVPTNSAGDATGCNIRNFTTAANPGSICNSTLGTGVTAVASLPYNSGAGTTVGAVDDLTSSNMVSCGSTSYTTGQDQVWVFTPTLSGPITITLTSTGSYTGLILFDGCPLSAGVCGAAPGTCVGYAQSSTGDKTLNVCVIAGVTYYLVLDSYDSPDTNPYSNLSIPAPSGMPIAANDMVCNATTILLGDLTPGDNSCTSGSGEPPAPSCWTNGSLNTVWYTFQAPASGNVKIKTMVGTLLNTQMAVYSGACGTGMTMVACNDNVAACGSSSYYNSELSLTGLIPGNWYYIVVDGYDALTGTFSIVAVDGAATWPPVPGQDCVSDVPVCAQTFTVGNPGYQAVGNICDFGTNYCLLSGERGSAWYEIKISVNGNLMFTIEPNDALPVGPGLLTDDGTDYDFAVWKKSGAGAVTCAQILSGGAVPLACNYSYIGVTGLYTGGNNPLNNAYTSHTYTAGAYDAAFEPPLPVLAGESYWLVISNFSNSLSGFTINFTNSTNGFNFTVPNPLIWTGGASTTDWFDARNWGNCVQIPTSTIDCIIAASTIYQPFINAAGAVCRSITINTGATLGIRGGNNLDVYGDYNNQGSLNALPASTVTMRGAAAQTMDGIMVLPSEFSNLSINKTAGTVITNQHIECGQSFTTSNVTSIMNMNNNNLTVGLNFNNSTNNTTFIPGTGILFFNGTGAQTFVNTTGNLFLHNVTMNHTGSGVTLNGANSSMIIDATGTLTLNSGVIITNALMVDVVNTVTTAVTPGNVTSYVQGNLRRRILSLGSYDFPVGNAAKGYQRANFNFTAATTITQLAAFFTSYGAVPAALGSTECAMTYDHAAIDNGYWTVASTPAKSNSGNYTATLYNLNYTNSAGSNGYTVMSDHTIPGTGPWQLLNGDGTNGTCVPSTVNCVIRQNMRGFSKFGTAASSNTPLPIDLLTFSGKALDKVNLVEWATVTETNNDYFLPEKSADGVTFVEMTRVKGAGNSNTTLYYSQIDEDPYNPVTYYKLKQVDFDGKYTYSDIISLAHANSSDQSELLNLYPNPTNSEINLEIYSPVDGFVEVEIVDMFGRTVIRQKSEVKMGNDVLIYDVSSLAAGAYFSKVSFITTGNTGYKRFIKEL